VCAHGMCDGLTVAAGEEASTFDEPFVPPKPDPALVFHDDASEALSRKDFAHVAVLTVLYVLQGVPLGVCVCVCVCVCVFVCVSIPVCVSVCVSISVCVVVNVSIPFCLSVCVSLSVFRYLSAHL
jgi:hypothetical protein